MSRKSKGWEIQIISMEGFPGTDVNVFFDGQHIIDATVINIDNLGMEGHPSMLLRVPLKAGAILIEHTAKEEKKPSTAVMIAEKMVMEEAKGPHLVTLKQDLGEHEHSHYFGLSCGHRLVTKTGLTYRMGQDVECLECSRGHEQARTTDAVYNPPVERSRREVAYFFKPSMDPDGSEYKEKMVLSCGHVYECPDPKPSEAKCTNCF